MQDLITNGLLLPIKMILMSLLATLSRIFYQKEKVTPSLVFARVIMSTFILWIAFTVCKDYFGMGEDTSLVIGGSLAFAFREVMDIFLFIMRNPSKIKESIKNL